MAEATCASLAFTKLLHDLEPDLLDRYENHLCYALARLNFIGGLAAIPARDKHLSLVVGVDEASEISEYQTVFVAESGARQQDSREIIIGDVDCQASGNQDRLAG